MSAVFSMFLRFEFMQTSFLKRRILEVIVWLCHEIFPVSGVPDDVVIFTIARFNDGIEIKGDLKEMEIREGQQFNITAEPRTANGNAAAYQDGTAIWASSDETIASVTANPQNELEAEVRGLDGSENASVVIEFRADGDPDADETRELIGTIGVTVTRGEATVFNLTAGQVSDIPVVV